MRIPALVLGFVLFASACRRAEPPPIASDPVASVAPSVSAPAPKPLPPSSAAFFLERTACLGKCPIYKLTIEPSGHWLLGGWYPQKGCAEGTLSPAAMTTLVERVQAIHYFELNDEYTLGETDMPSANTEVTVDGKTKKIHHYGFGTAPGEKGLTEFEKALDDAVGVEPLLAGKLARCAGKSPYPGVP